MYKQIDSNKRRTVILMVLFVILVLLLGWVFGEYTGYGYWGLIFALIISLVMTLFSYYKGDKVALWSAGAKPIVKEDNPYVFRMVENLCITAGLPMPKIYVINDPAPNAFATGRDPEHAAIALTSGIIEKLENEELEGVIAHELSHIKNYDIRLMMVVAVMVGIIVLISNWIFRIRGIGGRRSKGGGQIVAIIMIIGIVLALLSPLIAELIKMAVSRKREYLADASGALLTRYPAGLANALEKISAYKEPMRRANNGTAHLFISNPFAERAGRGLAHMFSTHPPVDDRIAKLRDMA
ncbi:M48 family metalloprotease [Candidatus Saccharibacteria bacterium]|nr:M48 family metallopeptidase [Candidatus Saccharibacteria bacterium]NIV04290.1 M48 family metalloprotease [Calditrichia bacterium]NIS38832.1 M48 family metallopeptidase [Candidatus Saccharibacteria bacterium]NIV72785.1 M48 family metalloprotease [Calditrichia bacterium]NIV99952.1 M48 family metalloprotease [Candidatus Saccharibacteria bacterium]